MKTAMQELIEEILCEQEIHFDENGDFIKIPNIQYVNAYKRGVDLSEYVNKALKKEKEQIMDAHIEGQRVFDNHTHTKWTNDQAEEYYNQTYNQNK
jgi:hypothetical protein